MSIDRQSLGYYSTFSFLFVALCALCDAPSGSWGILFGTRVLTDVMWYLDGYRFACPYTRHTCYPRIPLELLFALFCIDSSEFSRSLHTRFKP